MQLHHIVQGAEGGEDTMENCIPLCLDCHEEVGSYNPKHPIGRKFSKDELRKHRDLWFEFVNTHPERLSSSTEALFRHSTGDVSASLDVKVCVEFEHVLQTWGYSDFRPVRKKDLSKEHLLRVWLRNDGINLANHVEGSISIPAVMAWKGNPLLKGLSADTSQQMVFGITNEELIPGNGLVPWRGEKKPLLPKRRMRVHEERLCFYEPLTVNDDSKITWEVGADSSQPTQGEIRFYDIPIVDERTGD